MVVLSSLFILIGCSGSPKIQGKWNVQDASGEQKAIEIKDKTIIVNEEEYEYTQNAVGFKNGVSYYGLTRKDNGGTFSIVFPEKDKNIAIMLIPDSDDDYLTGSMLFAMNRKEKPDYKKYAEEYLNLR